jgi:hypothetical protein
LRSFLTARDVQCPKCEYNLRGLTGDRCPECGDQLVLRVNLAEPKLGAMIAGLVGLSAGAGFSGLLLIYTAIRRICDWHIFWALAPGFFVEGVLIMVWIVKWRRIRRSSKRVQMMTAIACWAITLVNVVTFSFYIK